MANFMKVFLNHVRYGAEAMYECVQDPPKSGVNIGRFSQPKER